MSNRRSFLRALLAVPVAPLVPRIARRWKWRHPDIRAITRATFPFWRSKQTTLGRTVDGELRRLVEMTEIGPDGRFHRRDV